MAEEQGAAKPAREEGGLVFKIAIWASLVVIPVIAAMVVYRFVVGPMLAAETAAPPEEPALVAQEDKIPLTAKTHSFEQDFVSIVGGGADMPSALLLYQVAFVCNDAVTESIVASNEPLFKSMLNKLHSFRTWEEVNDPLVRQNIEQQALKEANVLLRRLQDKPASNVRILSVVHEKWFPQSSL